MVKLNKNQAKAVAHIHGPCVVLAGPGSGKTRIISQRIVSMVLDHDIPPTRILAISFTKASSLEMKKRTLAYGKDERLNKVNFGTFHSSFFRILRRYAGVGLDDLLLDPDRFKLVRSILKYLKISNYNDDDVLDLLNEISLVKNELLDYMDYDSHCFEQEIFQKAYKLYEDEKKRYGKIDFDDMLIQAYDLLNDDPAILSIVRQVFKYILVDEFQDTSDIQYNIIKNLAAPQNNLFICGDDDQSIYGFNNAKPEIMLGFPDAYPGCGVARLSTNYRSDTDIVKAAGNLIHNNTARFEKDIVGKSKEEGHVELIYSKMDELIYQPIIRKVISENEEGVPFYDMAILTRTNKEGKFFALMCQKKIIPYYCAYSEVNLYKGALWNLLAPLCQKIRHQHKQNQTESSCCQPLLNSVSLHIFLSGLQHIHYHLNHLFISLFLHRSNSILQFPGSEKHLFCLFYGSIFLDEVQIGLHLSLNHDSGFFRFSHGFFYYGSFQIICDRFLEERFNSFSIFFPCL